MFFSGRPYVPPRSGPARNWNDRRRRNYCQKLGTNARPTRVWKAASHLELLWKGAPALIKLIDFASARERGPLWRLEKPAGADSP